METTYIENITDFLGKEDSRYFSQGYKHFDFAYENIAYQEQMLTGTVLCENNWDRKKNRHLHLGTVEYISLAATVCEVILEAEFSLSPEEIAACWISNFKMKIQTSIELSENTKVSILGKLISIQKTENGANQYKSSFEVRINTTIIKIEIHHPVYFWFNVSHHFVKCMNTSSMYCIGYKNRSHKINNIILNEALKNCTAKVTIEDHNPLKSGLSSLYDGTLLTDIILVSGQLVQTLFFALEKTDRTQANNLWLKEFEVSIMRPDSRLEYEAKIFFEDVKVLKKGNETWKSVKLKSELGSISSKIKMVSQINN